MDPNLSRALSLAGCSVMLLVGVPGNLLIVLTYFAIKKMQTLQNMFVVSLAVTDLILIAYILTFHMLDLAHGYSAIPREMCLFNSFVAHVCFITGIQTIMHISINRYIKICRTVQQYFRIYSRKNTILMVISCWTTGIIFSIPLNVIVGIDNIYDKTLMICGTSRQGDNPYILIFLFLTFGVPIVITSILYLAIQKHVWDGRRRLSRHWNNGLAFQRFRHDLRSTKLHSLIFIAYLALYIPLAVMSAITSNPNDVPVDVQKLSVYLCFANSCINCLLYGAFNRNIRLAYKKVLKCGFSLESNRVHHGDNLEMGNITTRNRVSQEDNIEHPNAIVRFQTTVSNVQPQIESSL